MLHRHKDRKVKAKHHKPDLRRLIYYVIIIIAVSYVSTIIFAYNGFSKGNHKKMPLSGPSNLGDINREENDYEYKHDSTNLPLAAQCNVKQKDIMIRTFNGAKAMNRLTKCPVTTWIRQFYEEEEDIGTDYFVGISVGCNKGNDAVLGARMGMARPEFDEPKWENAIHMASDKKMRGHVCRGNSGSQSQINFPERDGEMHCIEPMQSTFPLLLNASTQLGMDSETFVLANAVISSTNGFVKFPNAVPGTEDLGIHNCKNRNVACTELPMYTLDSYADKFIKSKGPVNILQIDTEGWDFDVLFGASSVLDRTYYLEFEYHSQGNWGSLHLQDAVKLLDGKGFTCYWAGNEKLWRITECYVDGYDLWHAWSNVACVHRSQTNLAGRMEALFLSTILHGR